MTDQLILSDGSKDPPITATWETITPAMAEDLIQTMTKRRNERRQHITNIVNKMQGGEWLCRAAYPIRIDRSGALLDGYHRLRAVSLVGVDQDFLVLRGYEPDDFAFFDEGATRSKKDQFDVMGLANAQDLAAAVSQIHRIAFGIRPLSNPQAEEFIRAHPRLAESVEFGRKLSAAMDLNIRVGASLHYLFSGLGYGCEFEKFCGKACDLGFDADKTSPVFLVRDKVRRLMENGRRYSKLERALAHSVAAFHLGFRSYLAKDELLHLELRGEALRAQMEAARADMLDSLDRQRAAKSAR